MKKDVKILIVEDEAIIAFDIQRSLTRLGYVVAGVVASGEHAITKVRTEPLDLVIMDIQLDGKMDGIEAADYIRTHYDIPILYLTTYANDHFLNRAKATGPFGYLLKPFHTKELRIAIEIGLYKHEIETELKETNRRLKKEIGERKQIEKTLQEAKETAEALNVSKDKFFSIIAHDLRGPLTSLHEISQMTEKNLDVYSQEKLKEIISIQRRSTDNLCKLLENLLTWARIQRGMIEYAPRQLDLKNVAAWNVKLFMPKAEQKQVMLRSAVQEETHVQADLLMVDTIIRNLISNALKFTKAGGTIEIAARSTETAVEIVVSDTGIGIKPDNIPKIFRIDTQYKHLGTDGEKGTGLGLILCKEFIEKHHGRIWIESEVGQGTTISFTLPKEA